MSDRNYVNNRIEKIQELDGAAGEEDMAPSVRIELAILHVAHALIGLDGRAVDLEQRALEANEEAEAIRDAVQDVAGFVSQIGASTKDLGYLAALLRLDGTPTLDRGEPL